MKHIINATGMINPTMLDIIHSSLVMSCLGNVLDFRRCFLHRDGCYAHQHLAGLLHLRYEVFFGNL